MLILYKAAIYGARSILIYPAIGAGPGGTGRVLRRGPRGLEYEFEGWRDTKRGGPGGRVTFGGPDCSVNYSI